MLQSAPLRLFAGIEHLRFMDGEKHLVFFGGFPPLARDADIADVFAARANDARVIVDYIWSGPCLPCRDLVEATGGFFSSVDTAAEALDKMDQRTRTSYLIGYEPSNPDLDDAVPSGPRGSQSAQRDGVYRNGYFASEELAPGDLRRKSHEHVRIAHWRPMRTRQALACARPWKSSRAPPAPARFAWTSSST